MANYATKGSQKWLQIAVNKKPQLLLEALQRSGAVAAGSSVTWCSPLENESFRERRDIEALEAAGIRSLKAPLKTFWPQRGPVWDAIGITSNRTPLFIEAKAHISEAASPATRATPASQTLIDKSLAKARRFYAPKSTADWSRHFYQYANRLAYQYFLKSLNDIPSVLVFLYFLNDHEMHGPSSETEWNGASQLIHAVLGVPKDLTPFGVFDAFLDTKLL
ncbi:MAG: hypothetical protein WA002_12100 [Candidatus Acidiferrales bacterium]